MSPGSIPLSAPNLAYCYQEILIVAARLRSRKLDIGDPAVFRMQVRKAVQQAEGSANSLGYLQEDVRLASFAAVSLLDETILTSGNRVFRDWAQKPLMLDLYGTLKAGETFFEYASAILKRRETKPTCDLLELYLLCLVLGFKGRHSSGSGEALHTWREQMLEKILRLRGTGDSVELSRSWLPAGDVDLPPPSNRASRLAFSISTGLVLAVLILVALYHFLLNRGVTQLAGMVRP